MISEQRGEIDTWQWLHKAGEPCPGERGSQEAADGTGRMGSEPGGEGQIRKELKRS